MSDATQAVEPVLDAASEAILDGVDGVVDTLEVVRNNPVALAAVGAIALVAGGAGGYFIAKQKLKSYYEDLATAEIAEARAFFSQVHKTDENGDVLTPQEVLATRHGQAAVEALRTYKGDASPEVTEEDILKAGEDLDESQLRKMEQARLHSVSVDSEVGPHGGEITVVEEKVEMRNVFSEPGFDYDEELKFRTKDKPYIITHDEFFAAETDYENISLTYYEVDDTLVDESDKPVEDVESRVGEDHLVRFGTASKDKNIVYIRNEKLQIDYEVVKSTGSYLEEVLGLPEEPNSLKHSDQRDRRRAFRHGDG